MNLVVSGRTFSKEEIEKRLQSKYFVNEDGCWQWVGASGGSRRLSPQIRINWKCFYASRVAYEIYNGPITDGLYVCHHCDNHMCINPAHMFLGTQKENMRDASRKGRLNKTVINESIVKWIKDLRTHGKTQSEISKETNIPVGTIGHILTGTRWGD